MNKQVFTAIIFFTDQKPAKYRNLWNLSSFKKFVTNRYPSALYYNLYDKKTKLYKERVYLRNLNEANWQTHLAK